jgi:hypothetical protein
MGGCCQKDKVNENAHTNIEKTIKKGKSKKSKSKGTSKTPKSDEISATEN